MAPYEWPATGDDCPQDLAKHTNCLKTDFDLVSKTSAISLSHSATLPSSLQPSILTGIEKGIAEARKNGYCPKWSKVDESIFRDVMLKNIAAKAALQARDCIPLVVFNGLHKSYNALHTKLVAQLPPTATSHQPVGADAPKTVTGPQERRRKNVIEKKSDDDSSEEENSGEEKCEEEESEDEESEDEESEDEEIKEEENEEEEIKEEESEEEEIKEEESEEEESKGQDAEDGQAVTDSEDNESGGDFSEDGSNDSSSDGEEENEDDAESDSDEAQEIVKEDTVGRAIEGMSGPSTTVKLEIKDQASINRLKDMEPSELLRFISCSLMDHLGEKRLSSAIVHISAASLLDSGHVNVAICEKTRKGPSIAWDLEGWDQRLERTLIGTPVPTYKVLMHMVETNTLVFRNLKEKSEIIRKLVDANRLNGDENGIRPIRDIYWAKDPLKKARALASLIVEFVDSEQANQVLVRGLSWQNKRHGCDRADEEGRLLRCGRCQAYGHLLGKFPKKCKAPYSCGKCAGPHSTKTCTSKIAKCASCGGGHYAGDTHCPEKAKARDNLRFKNENTSQATKSATHADRTTTSIVQRSMSAGRTQTEASMPSPVSLDAESAEDDVESDSKQSLPQAETAEDDVESEPTQSSPQADSAQDTSAELATLRQEFEDIKKKFVALDTILQSKVSGGTKRRADEAVLNGAGAESSDMAAKRIKKEEPTQEDSMGLYRQPSLYSEDRPQ